MGTREEPGDRYRGYTDVWTYPEVTGSGRKCIVHKAEVMAEGYRYSYWDICLLLCRLTTGLRIPWGETQSMVCSVFGYDCWNAAGIQIAQCNNCSRKRSPSMACWTTQGGFKEDGHGTDQTSRNAQTMNGYEGLMKKSQERRSSG
ncbi:hypothetical protein LLE49_26805 [Alicyclobacillus tolerans]|uniref:hypothetical protein n=1 Tax=Alicyclobacillus tolerans TaxID=90970 RepID=UPI001F3C10DF|nr:hypothetical protein [Alicyclobacillus tolerans]MCF8568336.1 hypothetical protein [Alicyclobacillus tolerans]